MAGCDLRGHRERGKFHRGLTDALLEYARAHFALSKPHPGLQSKTRLQVYRDVYRQTGVLAPELEALPVLPVEAEHVWEWFCELGGARSNGMEINPISWADIAAFFGLIRVRPNPWEFRAIRALDRAYIESRAYDEKGGVVAGAKAMKQLAPGKR